MRPRVPLATWPALLVASGLCFAPAFLATAGKRVERPKQLAWPALRKPVELRESSPVAGVFAATCVAAAVRVAAGINAKKSSSCQVTAVLSQDSTDLLSPAFVGTTAFEKVTPRGKVACRSVRSCYTLYFRRWKYYEDRARRNLRNRAYNIWMKNRYKKAMKKVLRFGYSLQQGDWQPKSHQEVMDKCKAMLDEACEVIDEVTVQGVLHRNTAAKRKDRMFRCILSGSVKKGVLERPSYKENPENRFLPAYKVIGYELPECNFVREPRPWQLPGWKSPWMLKWEWEKWRKATGRK
mmetsp:Transcript_32872/g.76015  ORF Transcript_32872/g.76015 Transcript_32872/m.76015 type:complete len:295 (+) Transcript_32872:57-941(+)